MAQLGSLKSRTLQRMAFLAGLPSTGTKAELATTLRSGLPQSRLLAQPSRILSIDMGIRNLAYCVLDLASLQSTSAPAPLTTSLRVREWRRLDLLGRLVPESAAKTDRKGGADNSISRKLPANAFTPSVMSRVAYGITTELLEYKPTIILIERQRFRSGGGSAIQEWTLRVNMLESMLWACFQAHNAVNLSTKDYLAPSLHEVSPAMVAKFWTAGTDKELRTPSQLLQDGADSTATYNASRSVDKKAKIGVARGWLKGEGGVSLQLQPEVKSVVDAFTTARRSSTRKKGAEDSEAESSDVGKLDDLADCLLQGAAWVRWEENRRDMIRLMEDSGYDLSP
ncbi:hypothetical protein B0A48_11967 [Cryoendolithus antarcticus]|uniref:Mitochondrial resolvase Ydc2 catalytic domain-containing protein n=1 Tax=Cryoendolithus antarcticus TaxID=1507870 RepID=A0A1V8STQ8_9PEZI|nr:hypothetical protein B0A48_11967 [Cryoendolithus antarcticus]